MPTILETLENIRKRLLDTTRRNRLINFRLNQKDCLRVVDELPDQLFDVLIDGKSMSFLPVPEPSEKQLIEKGYIAINPDTKEKEEIKPSPSAKQWAKEIGFDTDYELPNNYDASETEEKHSDLDLQTIFYPHELDIRLKKIYQKVQLSINETGTNILYVSVGFLEWNDGGDKNSFAPLFLIPVSLVKGKLNIRKKMYEYKISYSGQSIVSNLSLREKLKNDFNLVLPGIEEGTNPENYLKEIKKSVLTQKPTWKIHRYVSLSLLNFSQLLMYLDLHPDRWPDDASLEDHPLISKLLGGIGNDEDEIEPFDISEEPYPFDTYDDIHEKYPIVLDADSSQHSAIIEVIDGQNTVIEGPPGTGKSQTIVNLIAAAINQGKSVLFVAEKQAALKVVHDRLNNINLGDFCLNLWSHRSTKTEVFTNIKKRLDKYHKYPQRGIEKPKGVYEKSVEELNNYADKINSEWKSTKYTLHQIFTKAARYKELLTHDFLESIENNEDGFTKKEVENSEILLTDYQTYYEQVLTNNSDIEFASESPWYGFGNHSLQSFQKDTLNQSLQDWQNNLKDWQTFEQNTVKNYNFYEPQQDFNIKPKIIEDLDMLDFDNANIDFNALESINSSNINALKDSFHEYNTLLLRKGELLSDHGSEHFLSFTSNNELRNTSSNIFKNINSNLTLKDISNGLDDLTKFNSKLIETENPLNSINTLLFKRDKNDFNLSIKRVSEFISIIDLLSQLQSEHIQSINSSLDNSISNEYIDDLKSNLIDLNNSHDALSEIYKIDSMPDWIELNSLKDFLNNSGFLQRMKSDYKAAKNKLLSFKATPYIKFEKLLNALTDASDYKKKVADFNSNQNYIKAFGDNLNGHETDLKIIEINMLWFKNIRNTFGDAPAILESFKNISNLSLRDLKDSINDDLKNKLTDLESNLGNLGDTFTILLTDNNSSLNGDAGIVNKTLKETSEDITSLEQFPSIFASNLTVFKIKEMIDDMKIFVDDCEKWEEEFKSYSSSFSALDLLKNLESESSNSEIENTLNLAETIYLDLENSELISNLNELKIQIQTNFNNCEKSFEKFNKLAKLDLSKWQPSDEKSLDIIIEKNDNALNSFSSLDAWVDYIRQLNLLIEPGLDNFADQFDRAQDFENPSLNYENIVDVYRSIVFNHMAHKILISDDTLGRFSSFSHKNLQELFIKTDNELKKAQVDLISYNADSQNQMLSGNRSGAVKTYTEASLLRHEADKRTRHVSLRQLTLRAGKSLKAIKPCFMMSPMSVAQYLSPGKVEFDIVVMDEASQLKPQFALGAIARGKQLVVVGDPKQLPPTNFFQKNVIDDDNDEITAIEESESILDVAMPIMPMRRLNWHYRSRHQSLIAFSNYAFYDDSLKVFPSASGISTELGLQYSRLEGCLFINRKNIEEAKIVAKAVKEQLLNKNDKSLGVIAFSLSQEKEITDQIEILAREDRVFSRAYDKNRSKDEEPFFVKNIESVQGDERDVIFISMTYGPETPGGPVYKRFNTGSATFWRRLNVLYTRSKDRKRVFSSYGSEDIDNAKDKGMIALNGFLKYCETKKIDRTIITNRQPDSDFEVSVMQLLSSYNFDCVPQVGEAGFFIDIAVRDQNKPGKFLMAIECDGATYHSSKTARDRDRLRQQILEGHGWKVRRIWSTDWFNDQNAAIKPIIDELKKLTKESEIEKKNDEMVDQIISDTESIDEIYDVETVEMAEAQYLEVQTNLFDTLSKFKKEVIEKEFPDTKIENQLLKPSMIEALNHFQPTNNDEFLELIPAYIRENINASEASQYLDSVLNIISSYVDSSDN